jgi:NOL1/NOP2/fmu family ribosome biogenesis protein
VKISIPFGYYRAQVSAKTTRSAVVEFIDADAPVISADEAPVVASWRVKNLPPRNDWKTTSCRHFQGNFLVPVVGGRGEFLTDEDLPKPDDKTSKAAYTLMALMPMFPAEPIQVACLEALSSGEVGNGRIVDHRVELDRAGRIQRADRVARSFVVIDGTVWRRVPEPKLKLCVFSGKMARLGIYFGGIHLDENGKTNFRGEYIVPMPAAQQSLDLVQGHGIVMLEGDIVETVDRPDLFTFSASMSLAETLSRRVASELKSHVGLLDHDDIARWVDLREMTERLGRFDYSVGNDIRGEFDAPEMLDLIGHLAGAMPDTVSRRDILMALSLAQEFEQTMTARAASTQRPMGSPRQ